MQLKLIQMSPAGPQEIDFSGDPVELDSKNSYWLGIKAEKRNELVNTLEKFEIRDRALELILDPIQSNRFNVFSDTVIANMEICSVSNIYEFQYLSVLKRITCLFQYFLRGMTFLNGLSKISQAMLFPKLVL